MLGFVPAILDAASRDTYEYIKRLAEDIDRDATGELRKQSTQFASGSQSRSKGGYAHADSDSPCG